MSSQRANPDPLTGRRLATDTLDIQAPDLPHLLLLIANIVIVGGVVWVWVAGYLLMPRVPPRR